MNERILKLADEAGMSDDKFGMFFAKDKHNEDGVDLEKFAELILTEVISTIYRSDISDKKQERLVDELAYKFGMK